MEGIANDPDEENRDIDAPLVTDVTDEEVETRKTIRSAMGILSKNIWFDYKKAKEIIREFEIAYIKACRYFENPQTSTDIRPISLFLTGDINTGKTSLVVKYNNLCQQLAKIEGKIYSKWEIIVKDTPVKATAEQMFLTLLDTLGVQVQYDNHSKPHLDVLIGLLIKELRKKEVKMLFLDDIQDINKDPAQREYILTGLRKISNLSQTRLVLVGTPEAIEIFQDANWVDERFKPLVLPAWDYSKEYLDMLYTTNFFY
ncbi:MAG: AAA family ATPase [Candidatus Lokiarchaeota archaeon]|nr:AAA family ATPase [Candidatus Lokiarchaeota archaeon]